MVVGCRCRHGCAEAVPTSAPALGLGLLLERPYNSAECDVRGPELMFASGPIHVRPSGWVWRLADLRRLGFAAELCRQLRTLVRAAADPGDSSSVCRTLWQIRPNQEALTWRKLAEPKLQRPRIVRVRVVERSARSHVRRERWLETNRTYRMHVRSAGCEGVQSCHAPGPRGYRGRARVRGPTVGFGRGPAADDTLYTMSCV